MGYRQGYRCGIYGIWYIDRVIYRIDMVILDVDMGYRANDMADDSIDMVILDIDMGCLVTLPARALRRGARAAAESR